MRKYNIICMSFDGEYQIEECNSKSVDEAWEYANNLGSKWFFFPFYFVVNENCETVVDCPYEFEYFKNKRVKTVSKFFNKMSIKDENQNIGVDDYIWNITAEMEK